AGALEVPDFQGARRIRRQREGVDDLFERIAKIDLDFGAKAWVRDGRRAETKTRSGDDERRDGRGGSGEEPTAPRQAASTPARAPGARSCRRRLPGSAPA